MIFFFLLVQFSNKSEYPSILDINQNKRYYLKITLNIVLTFRVIKYEYFKTNLEDTYETQREIFNPHP